MPSSSSSSTNEHLPPSQKTASTKRKAGRKKFQETRHPIYKGVRQRNGKWVSELRWPNKNSTFWVGTFCSPEMAAVAYDVVALTIKGESAPLNFPNWTHLFPRVTSSSSSINDIRTMAVEAAEAFTSSNRLSSLSSSSLCSSLTSEEKVTPKVLTDRLVLDEEEVFNMPAIIADMAEGLILTPPGMKKGFNWEEYEDTVELSLWNDDGEKN
ncbi:dehydration-responsive element-binding protein 1B-like [Cucurbita pepo subsp. pepo]|uniref:dehydration-responsive element-binding protein 1B-like n=1 Tax=Cucurbita pepo subsp. pepo TaxID=3664 RepID=UPI000C9D5A6D|nr:dehydration-responsive element-binding protein 1B-like [Cucurbita pepo subsp. pepo]